MRYLIDTNVLSNLEKARPNPRLQHWLAEVPSSDIFIPVNAIFEIQKGIELAWPTNPGRAAERERWLDDLLGGPPEGFVPLDCAAARTYAKMVCTPALRNFFLTPGLNAKKIKTGDDLAIAAIAIGLEAVVVSFNDRDFMLIHRYFPLPGLFHPGRLEWCVGPSDQIASERERSA